MLEHYSVSFTRGRCARCNRRGLLCLDRLIAQHGADAPVPAVLRAVVDHCLRRDEREREQCDPYLPELKPLFIARLCTSDVTRSTYSNRSADDRFLARWHR
jgi:hypothetical protein